MELYYFLFIHIIRLLLLMRNHIGICFDENNRRVRFTLSSVLNRSRILRFFLLLFIIVRKYRLVYVAEGIDESITLMY